MLALVRLYSVFGWRIQCARCGLATAIITIDSPQVGAQGKIDETTRYTSAQAAEIAIARWNYRYGSAHKKAPLRVLRIRDGISQDSPSERTAESESN